MMVRRRFLAADMFCTKPTDVASEDRLVLTSALDHGLVVAPIIRVPEPVMDHHVARKAQVILIRFADGEGFAVVLRMSVDDAPLLPASDAPDWSSERTRSPLTV